MFSRLFYMGHRYRRGQGNAATDGCGLVGCGCLLVLILFIVAIFAFAR